MSSICSDTTKCPGGNCPGCRNGLPYCQDPRCYPNCQGCNTSTPSNSNWILVTVILVLLGIMLILAFFIGYDWYTSKKKANEPKTVNINKHFHTIKEDKPIQSQMPMMVQTQIPSMPMVVQSQIPLQVSRMQNVPSVENSYRVEPPPFPSTPVSALSRSMVSTNGLELSIGDLPEVDMGAGDMGGMGSIGEMRNIGGMGNRMSIGGSALNISQNVLPKTNYSSLSCNRNPIQGIE